MVGCSQGRIRVGTCKSEKDSDKNRHRGLVKKIRANRSDLLESENDDFQHKLSQARA